MMLQICFHNLSHSPAVETKVRQRVQKLERICEDITSCRVAIDAPHRRHVSGNAYCVQVEVKVPGEMLVAKPRPDRDQEYSDLFVAIRDAFDSMRRQLKAYAERQQAPKTRSGIVTA